MPFESVHERSEPFITVENTEEFVQLRPPATASIVGVAYGIAYGRVGAHVSGANRNDLVLLAPTLDDALARGLLGDIETLWLDRGHDANITRGRFAERGIADAMITKKRKRGVRGTKQTQPMGQRWPVERTNSWFSNYGELRRNTDRKTIHRDAQLAVAIAFLLTAKLIDWRNRWSPDLSPIC